MGCAASAACVTGDKAPAANMVFKYVLRFMSLLSKSASAPVSKRCSKSRLLPGHRQFDAVQSGPGRDIQRFAVIAPIAVGRRLRRLDRAQVLAIRGEHPHSTGAAAIDIAQ